MPRSSVPDSDASDDDAGTASGQDSTGTDATNDSTGTEGDDLDDDTTRSDRRGPDEARDDDASPHRATSTSDGAPTAKRPKRRQKPVELPTPLLGARALIAAIPLVGIATLANAPLNSWINNLTHEPVEQENIAEWKVGNTTRVKLTLVTADANRLSCAHDTVFGEEHCGFSNDKTPRARAADAPLDDNGLHLVQPYRTVPNNKLVLVSGIWATPEVALRHALEPPFGVAAEKLARFEIACEVEFVGELKDAWLRWDNDGRWQKEATALVAKARGCELAGRVRDTDRVW